ncbi:MAG TPA: prolipoprotein diacylglyceryl transferase family protein [Burkholderiaceae bacterium]|nr:prolipoprotein diacylglyceryl transferase family protein [Burkholderiaceae bacterium]
MPLITTPEAAAQVHGLLEFTAMALGAALYRRARRGSGLPAMTAKGSFALMVGLLLGAGLGNKLVFLVERPDLWLAFWQDGQPLRLGQSLVGGLLGGLIGIELAKALTRQPASTGDLMVWPLAIGIALGRVGCFLAGLHDDTYGLPSTLPWALDLGDGIPRHPTALYEIVFVLATAALLHHWRDRLVVVPGLAFKIFLAGYLLWRLLIDGLKPVRVPYALGLSGIQWVCLLALLCYLPFVARAALRLRRISR